jgi:hypothetical protein
MSLDATWQLASNNETTRELVMTKSEAGLAPVAAPAPRARARRAL